MKKITLLILLLFPLLSFSQQVTWDWAYSHSLHFSNGVTRSAVDPQGNVYVIGNFKTSQITVGSFIMNQTGPSGTADIYIIKYSPAGVVLWARTVGGTGNDADLCIATDKYGNMYMAGIFFGSLTLGNFTLQSSINSEFLVKFDSAGNVLFAKKAGMGIQQIIVDASQNIYLAGVFSLPVTVMDDVTINYENYLTFQTPRACVAKLDPNGTCIWAQPVQTNDGESFIFGQCLTVDTEGSVYFGGKFNSQTVNAGNLTLTKTVQGNYQRYNMFLIKYNASGIVQWAKNPGNSDSSTDLTSIVSDNSNNIYTSGNFSNMMFFGQFWAIGRGMYLVKYNSEGNELWVNAPYGNNVFSMAQSSAIDEMGNIYVAGTFSAAINFNNNIMLGNSQNQGSFYIVKYNAAGEAIWAKSAGPESYSSLISVSCSNQNEVYLSGSFNSPSLAFGNTLLTKSQGPQYDSFVAKLHQETLGTSGFEMASISVFPNPADNIITVNTQEINSSYTLIDVTGKVVATGVLGVNREISVRNMPTGIYILKLTSGSKFSSAKIIKI